MLTLYPAKDVMKSESLENLCTGHYTATNDAQLHVRYLLRPLSQTFLRQTGRSRRYLNVLSGPVIFKSRAYRRIIFRPLTVTTPL